MQDETSENRWNEADRVAALEHYKILDTPAEVEFDDIARIAADVCETPIAVVNLVTDRRQFFKAEVGLGVRETPLDTSFCRHALLEQDLLVVPDTTRDPRFDCNPLVTGEPHLRFYAGALLKTEEGLPLGTVCVLDYEPRQLTDKQVRTLQALARQATSQMQLRLALRERGESESRLRSVVAAAPFPIMLHAEDGEVLELSRKWTELSGYTRAAIGTHFDWARLAYPDGAERFDEEIAREFGSEGENAAGEWEIRVKDGSTRVWDFHNVGLGRLPDGRRLQISAAADVTEGKLAEARLRKAAAEFEALAENVSQLAWMAEPDGSVFWYNKRWYDYTGTDFAAMQGWGWREVQHPDHIDRIIAEVQRNWAAGEAWEGTYQLRSAEGEYRWFLTRAEPIRNEAGELVRWFGTNTDITAQFVAETKLREVAERYRLAALATNDAIWDWDLRTSDVVWNEAVQTLFGHAGAVNGTSAAWWIEHIHPDDRARIDASIHAVIDGNGLSWSDEYRFLRADGSYADILDRGTVLRDGRGQPLRMIGAMLDLTERKAAEQALRQINETLESRIAEALAERERVEEALRQSQKMEVVGQLTGGVAHDFNNLLQIVTGNLDILQRKLPDDELRLRRAANNAMTGAKRATALTQRLLAFSRRQPLDPKPISVNRLVTDMSDLLGRTLGETIEIETILAGGLWPVEADPNQLENAILNLAVNARDAMPDGGKLTVETANSHLDHAYAMSNAEVPPGQYVVICVTDTGAGMDKETVARAFEPFYTTKEVGKGTGLGLSQVYGFVKQSGGNVKIYSEIGEGTTVKVYLPRLLSDVAEDEADAEHLAPGGERSETILVVEDDDDVRAYSVEVLRELGYRVLEAHDGPSALRLLERQDEPVDLLFSDVVLPGGMTGAVVATEARKLLPDLKVLFTTGYARNAIVHQGRLDAGVHLLTKPFTFEDLAARVRDILDGQA